MPLWCWFPRGLRWVGLGAPEPCRMSVKRLLPADPPMPAAAPPVLGQVVTAGRRGGGPRVEGQKGRRPSLARPSPGGHLPSWPCSAVIGCPPAGGTGAGRPGAIGPRFSPSPVPLCFLTFASFSSSFQKWLRDPSAVSLLRRRCRPLMARGCLPGNCAPGSCVPTLPSGRPGSSVSSLCPARSGLPTQRTSRGPRVSGAPPLGREAISPDEFFPLVISTGTWVLFFIKVTQCSGGKTS